LANIFSHSVGVLFSLETISFDEQKLFSFMGSMAQDLILLSGGGWKRRARGKKANLTVKWVGGGEKEDKLKSTGEMGTHVCVSAHPTFLTWVAFTSELHMPLAQGPEKLKLQIKWELEALPSWLLPCFLAR
jgi:hypothetical protein